MERYCRHRHLANELYGALSLAATTVLLHGHVWDKARRQSFDSRGVRLIGVGVLAKMVRRERWDAPDEAGRWNGDMHA